MLWDNPLYDVIQFRGKNGTSKLKGNNWFCDKILLEAIKECAHLKKKYEKTLFNEIVKIWTYARIQKDVYEWIPETVPMK